MDYNSDRIISDDFEWTLVVKAIHDEVVRLRERVTDLETEYIISNPAPKLTVIELAKVIMNYDTVLCPFCDRERLDYHQELCPFTFAAQVLADVEDESTFLQSEYETAAAVATDLAQSLTLDAAVRVIAKSGKNHDGGPNWYAECDRGELQISSTFGAGTNSASVRVTKTTDGGGGGALSGTTLYEATNYGRHVSLFRVGPWVNRLLAHANALCRANKSKAQEHKFEEVDF